MNIPQSSHYPAISKVLNKARKVLWLEQRWPVFLGFVSIFLAYICLGLCGVLQSLPDMLRWILLLGFISIIIGFLYISLRSIPPIKPIKIIQRIEHASGLKNQPLLTLEDIPANKSSITLWQIHIQRILNGLPKLKTGFPRIFQQQKFLNLICFGMVFLFTLLVYINGNYTPSRLVSSFRPGYDDATIPLPKVEAWIEPAAYSNEPPIYLQNKHDKIEVPQNSHMHITITGLVSKPQIYDNTNGTIIPSPHIQQLDRITWQIDGLIVSSGKLFIKGRGRHIAQWLFDVPPNNPPSISWTGPITLQKETLYNVFPFAASQRYGIAELQIKLYRSVSSPKHLEAIDHLSIPLIGHPHQVKQSFKKNLTDSIWVGETIFAVLQAKDISGQQTQSNPAPFIIPNPAFITKTAKSIQKIRIDLGRNQENHFNAALRLQALTNQSNIFESHDLFLNLVTLIALLNNDNLSKKTITAEAVDRLWQMALDVEERQQGNPAMTRMFQNYRAAQENLRNQLAVMRQKGKNVTYEDKEKLQKALDNIQAVIGNKVQDLITQAKKQNIAIPNSTNLTNLKNNIFNNTLKRLRKAAENGDQAETERQLQKLTNMLSKMKNATPEDIKQLEAQAKQRQKADYLAKSLEAIIQKQMTLLDHSQARQKDIATIDQNDQGTDSDQDEDLTKLSTPELLKRLGVKHPQLSTDNTDNNEQQKLFTAEEDNVMQQILKHALAELQKQAKELTGKQYDNFQKAQQDMSAASKALDAKRDRQAAKIQQQILVELQKGNQQMQQSMQQSSSESPLILIIPSTLQPSSDDNHDSELDEDNMSSKNKDLLGRDIGKEENNLSLSGERSNAHAIEEELRKRAADPERPAIELDYLNRLLKLF